MALDLNRIRKSTGEDWNRVQSLIRDALDSDIDILNSVNGQILSNSGKQLRPLLSILTARACSGGHPVEASFHFASAAELLHNATLFHDDVADSSDERRGVPTLRAMMGPSVSVLVGDFWLVKAVQLILGQGLDKVGNRVVELFSKTLCDLVEGEMLQLQKSRTEDTTEEDYLRIIYGKTASLFETGGLAAAISVGADKVTEEAVGRYSRFLGMAFQIRDDIMDYELSEAQAGKPVGADVAEGLITLPLFGAFRNVPCEIEAGIRSQMKGVAGDTAIQRRIIEFVGENKGVEYALMRLGEYADEAVAALPALPETEDRECLEAIARHLGRRE